MHEKVVRGNKTLAPAGPPVYVGHNLEIFVVHTPAKTPQGRDYIRVSIRSEKGQEMRWRSLQTLGYVYGGDFSYVKIENPAFVQELEEVSE
jgi:hypothetical protein